MNDKLIQGLEEILNPKTDTSSQVISKNLAAIGSQSRSIAEITASIDKNDLNTQLEYTSSMVGSSFTSSIDRLRHRADMLRERAQELDDIADSAQKSADDLMKSLSKTNDLDKEIRRLLYEHSNFKPKRVDNGSS